MTINRAQRSLLLIFALFMLPLIAAMLMNSRWWQYQPDGQTNYGALVEPVQPLDPAAAKAEAPAGAGELAGRWAILYPVGDPCAGACLSDIESLRQIHRASGRHQGKIAMVLVRPPGASPAAREALRGVYAQFWLLEDADGLLHRQLGALSGPTAALAPGQAFLADPAGNIMMRYAPGFDPNHLNKDLKRLLKWSAQNG